MLGGDQAGMGGRKQQGPPPASTGGGPGGKEGSMLFDAIGPVALVGFEGLDRDAHLLAEKLTINDPIGPKGAIETD